MTLTNAHARRHALRAWTVSRSLGLHEIVVVVVAFLVYFFIRGAVVDRAPEAFANARDIIQLQQQLGIYTERTWQEWALDHFWFIKLMNWIYFWGHMPLVIVVAIWLYTRHRGEYHLTRNAFLASGAIAVVIYWLYPVAPPRLIPGEGFIDTMAQYDRISYNAQEAGAFVNPYAAVPSLHFGWSLLLGAVIGWVGRNPFAVLFGIAWPFAMFVSIVVTGNHFILDAVAGGVVSFAGLGVARALQPAWPRVEARVRRLLDGATSGMVPAQRALPDADNESS